MKRKPLPDRISLAEMLVSLAPMMSKSSFYGTSRAPGPRWTLQEKLDLRNGANSITADRMKFNRWLSTLYGESAALPHPNAIRLGRHACPQPSAEPYGVRMAILCEALASGTISKEQFDKAVHSLGAG
jgi:hypothetical protein